MKHVFSWRGIINVSISISTWKELILILVLSKSRFWKAADTNWKLNKQVSRKNILSSWKPMRISFSSILIYSFMHYLKNVIVMYTYQLTLNIYFSGKSVLFYSPFTYASISLNYIYILNYSLFFYILNFNLLFYFKLNIYPSGNSDLFSSPIT